jgi:molecular chaperone GrpE
MTDEPIQQEDQVPCPPAADTVSRPGVGGFAADASSEESGDARVAALEDRLLRTAADFDNYKKRALREREQYVTLANERLVKELLPILDDLERALAAVGEHQEATVEEGVRLVHRSLESLLERNGVKRIDTEGKFDPHVHEALLSQPSDAEEGSVIDVVQKGYTLGDRVVRPARVVIAAAPEGSDG